MLINEHRREGMLPTSARFLFYELVARAIISKETTENAGLIRTCPMR